MKRNGAIEKITERAAVVVPSYDGGFDLWGAFFTLFKKYWPDCPYPIYLLSENLSFSDTSITTIQNPLGLDWSSRMQHSLDQLPYDYLLVVLDDFFVKGPVDTHQVAILHDLASDTGAAYLRLLPIPPPDRPFQGRQDVGLLSIGAPYRTSLMTAWWHKETLFNLLVPGESPWDFELKGTIRSDAVKRNFLSAYEPQIDFFVSAVVGGKWDPEALKLFEAENIEIDMQSRSVQTSLDRLKREWRARILDAMARALRRTRQVSAQ